ncbi:tail assembly chaperone [Arthrobacter phage Thunderclap]|nr:tail assembly chaperone [Arthrobacter phage Amigo]ALY08480.1 tail assembly chaperone [Arthrobacter phage Anansi]ALY09094.1 tail assembly chaperone [Arthrobacter phage Gorgeous]ALY10111.1 tail assembly chaperone [Arthrobacter phage Rings]ALY10375.1 tail assembly chaperone [Arthrobacter phage SorJuana]QOR56090.1 tail assembly chaperone [Arthrobacter phage Thunderclap]
MSEVTEEIQGMVTAMREEKPFSALDAIREVKYPTGKTRVYTNGELAGELEEAYEDRRLAQADGALASAELNEAEAKIEQLEKQIKSSALTFHMRGVPPKVKRLIAKEGARKFKIEKSDDEQTANDKLTQQNEYITYELIRHSIVKVEDANGGVDTHGWTADEIRTLDEVMIESEFGKIDELCAKLSSAAHVFNESLDADFFVEVLTRPENKGLLLPIKTAKEWGWSPTAVLTGSKKVHKHYKHDQALAMALQIIEEEKCQSCGLPIWIGHSENASMEFSLEHVVCYACEFEDQETSKKSYNRKKGHTPYVRPWMDALEGEDDSLPTRTEFLKDKMEKAIAKMEREAREKAELAAASE